MRRFTQPLRLVLAVLSLDAVAMADQGFAKAITRLETRSRAKIGVFATRGDKAIGHRADQRFAYCSTFKWILGAAVLKRVEVGQLSLNHPITYTERDLLGTSPVTQAHVKTGHLSVGELCAATITTSDNTAANLLEPLVGGPSGLQAFVRSLGDPTTRFDRIEPELNSNRPGDPRDTTTPEAMTRLLRSALEGEALSKASQAQLLTWMKATVTGPGRIRAGLPPGWTLGHKTGTSGNGAVNDVAVLLPPQGLPIYLSIFTNGKGPDDEAREAAIAEVTRQVLKVLP